MFRKLELNLAIYSSLFIALAVNLPRITFFKEDGIMARHIGILSFPELFFQILLNVLFCYYFFRLLSTHLTKPLFRIVCFSVIFLVIAVFISTQIQFFVFGKLRDQYKFLLAGCMVRYLMSMLFCVFMVKITALLKTIRRKELENDQLNNRYLHAELNLLKQQINPHFLFNSLSTLSGIVVENPQKAQLYIGQMGKYFRYTLNSFEKQLVPLQTEIDEVQPYIDLLGMRFENGLQVEWAIREEDRHQMLPHLSLQPLLENAVKHNLVSIGSPLIIRITSMANTLTVSNNLQPIKQPQPHSGKGLANVKERFMMLVGKAIGIEKTLDAFIITLPLTPHT